MSFASPIFLWYFMPLLLAVYWATPRHWRNGVLAFASLLFYAWGGGRFVLLLLGLIALNYTGARIIDAPDAPDRRRRAVLVGTVALDLAGLVVWKYGTFGLTQLHDLTGHLGVPQPGIVRLTLPIGISFYTFHHLSYVVDVYRRDRPAQRRLLTFVTYIAMFPQLIAGPIVRYHEIDAQLTAWPRDKVRDLASGFPRFALGLAKKVVVADSVAPIADACFNHSPGAGITTGTAWLGMLCYTVQIYFDFSGYSDMAIGLGHMFGFTLPENFARPYSAASVTDFWRRWHMSLSRWFRDYVYIPLGGNRGGRGATYRNLIAVFLLTGIWHGAAWTFVVWGTYHGALLTIERATGWGRDVSGLRGPVRAARRTLTLLLVMIGWVLFRAPSLSAAGHVLSSLVVPRLGALPPDVTTAITRERLTILSLACLVALLPGSFVMGRFLELQDLVAARVARLGYALIAAPAAGALVAAGTFSPFLYFQF